MDGHKVISEAARSARFCDAAAKPASQEGSARALEPRRAIPRHHDHNDNEPMTERIKGILSPVLTPFQRDYRPDAERFISHCRWLLANDVSLAVFGTNFEANSLSGTERAH